MAQDNQAQTAQTGGPDTSDGRDTEALRSQIRQLRADLDGVSRELGGVGRSYLARGKGAARAAGDAAEGQVREHPLMTVAASLLGGLILGLLLGGRDRR